MPNEETPIVEGGKAQRKIVEIPTPPTILNAEGKKKYLQIANMLSENGNFEIGDELALAALCVNYQRWLQVERVIKKKKSFTFMTDTGYRQQIPELSIARDCMKTMLTFIREFGLTPKERAKLTGAIIDTKDIDKELDNMVQ